MSAYTAATFKTSRHPARRMSPPSPCLRWRGVHIPIVGSVGLSKPPYNRLSCTPSKYLSSVPRTKTHMQNPSCKLSMHSDSFPHALLEIWRERRKWFVTGFAVLTREVHAGIERRNKEEWALTWSSQGPRNVLTLHSAPSSFGNHQDTIPYDPNFPEPRNILCKAPMECFQLAMAYKRVCTRHTFPGEGIPMAPSIPCVHHPH